MDRIAAADAGLGAEMSVIAAGGLLLVALFFGALSAFGFRALVSFAKRGPASAREAFEHGESVRVWWRAEPVTNMGAEPRDDERYAMGGRHDAEVGDEFVEERAAYAR